MIDHHFTGAAALVSALALLLHALRAALPKMIEAMATRAESVRLDAETRAAIETARALTEDDLRARLDRCDAGHRATRDEMERRSGECEVEIATLRGQLSAMHDELDAIRRSITAGHSRA